MLLIIPHIPADDEFANIFFRFASVGGGGGGGGGTSPTAMSAPSSISLTSMLGAKDRLMYIPTFLALPKAPGASGEVSAAMLMGLEGGDPLQSSRLVIVVDQ